MNLKLDLTKEYEVKLNYCPNCRSKLKIIQEECPSCGINIIEYLQSILSNLLEKNLDKVNV